SGSCERIRVEPAIKASIFDRNRRCDVHPDAITTAGEIDGIGRREAYRGWSSAHEARDAGNLPVVQRGPSHCVVPELTRLWKIPYVVGDQDMRLVVAREPVVPHVHRTIRGNQCLIV